MYPTINWLRNVPSSAVDRTNPIVPIRSISFDRFSLWLSPSGSIDFYDPIDLSSSPLSVPLPSGEKRFSLLLYRKETCSSKMLETHKSRETVNLTEV